MIHMNEILDILTPKEMGSRLQLVRQGLQLTQKQVAEIIGTTQLKISKIEQGNVVTTPMFLRLLAFYSQSVSLEVLFSEKIDFVTYEHLFNHDYAMGKMVKARLTHLRRTALDNLQKAHDDLSATLDEAISLL